VPHVRRVATNVVAAALLVAAALVGAPAAPAAAAASCIVTDGAADSSCTPGVLNSDVTQATVRSTICVPGWTATIRPPASYTTALKNRQKITYGEADIPNSGLEEDHLVPLELGGAPRDTANLWPEPRVAYAPAGRAAEDKDHEENALKKKVCADRLTLAAAQAQMLADWTH
jgi:hypothetical protein